MIRLVVLIIGSLLAQTRSTGPQVFLVPKDDGVLLTTQKGYKVVFPSPGFMYIDVAGEYRAQILTSYCSWNHQISEVPTRQSNGTYKFRIYPNPASIAVYKNGVRLTPDKHYKLIWTLQNELPTHFEVFGSTELDDVVVDYFTGASTTVP